MRPRHDAGIAGGGAGQAGWPGDTEALGGEGQHRHQGGGGPHRAAPLQVMIQSNTVFFFCLVCHCPSVQLAIQDPPYNSGPRARHHRHLAEAEGLPRAVRLGEAVRLRPAHLRGPRAQVTRHVTPRDTCHDAVLPRPSIAADDWTLVIREARAEDSGQYECSLHTRPRLSSRVSLRVEDTAAVDQDQVGSRAPR